ncbi:peptidase family C54-domain-containing protein [Mycena rosella]|uniref:Cysteine protease n=1 Tax=Mycena rosella TaxID=1033263 RepID=A0AAD7BY59_MYCRO|nr:peptidase family C54-domain-containing protein [Mycena rosella]
MALAGKAAGKDVGMWFGPSAAAAAMRTLVDAFPACGLGVSVATDGTLYQTEVFAASHSPASLAALHAAHAHSSTAHSHSSSATPARSPGSSAGHSAHSKGHGKPETKVWGDRPVLLLLGIRLGLDGVNPVYHETIKLLYTFPQSVGIAGGRPSSSYYFVGVQENGLFYLDPHHSRPAVPLRPFIPDTHNATPTPHAANDRTHATFRAPTHNDRRSLSPDAPAYGRGGSMSPDFGPGRAGSMSPELVYSRGGSMSPGPASEYGYAQGQGHAPMTEDELVCNPRDSTASARGATIHATTTAADSTTTRAPAGGFLSPAEEAHYVRAYSATELRTFHCERVRKMPLTGLDPSMLLGFVCRDEAEWVDLRRRVSELPRTIFAIQDEPPTWPGADDDDDMGLESVSDPEEEPVFDDGDVSSASHAPSSSAHAASNTSHVAASAFSHTHQHSNSNSTASSGEVDTDDDPVAPVTPLPGARFDLSGGPSYAGKVGTGKLTAGDKAGTYPDLLDDEGFVDAGGEAEIEDDWIDPVTPPPPPSKKEKERERAAKGKSGKSKGKKAVPVPNVHYPFPVSVEDSATGAGAGVPASPERQERQRNVTVSPKNVASGGQRMHTARARDGGRTQSGGVRGVLTTED